MDLEFTGWSTDGGKFEGLWNYGGGAERPTVITYATDGRPLSFTPRTSKRHVRTAGWADLAYVRLVPSSSVGRLYFQYQGAGGAIQRSG